MKFDHHGLSLIGCNFLYPLLPFKVFQFLLEECLRLALFLFMVCRNICERLDSNTGSKDGSINYCYLLGKKYCRRCEVYLYYNQGIFCPCCGMQLRTTPTTKKGKERLMKYRLRKKKMTIDEWEEHKCSSKFIPSK